MDEIHLRYSKAIKALIEIAMSNLPADTEIIISVSNRNSATVRLSPFILKEILKE